MIQLHDQPKALSDGSLNALGNPSSLSIPNPSSLSIPIPVTDLSVPFVRELEYEPKHVLTVPAQNHDLSLPIALRKGA